MEPENSYEYTLELSSASQYVALPVKLRHVNKLRIKELAYTTATQNNRFMIVDIVGWNGKACYFNGKETRTATKILLMPTGQGQMMMFGTDSNKFDVIKHEKESLLTNFEIRILINGQISGDISPTNTVLLTVYVEGDN